MYMRLFDWIPSRTNNLKQVAIQAVTAGFILNILHNLATEPSHTKNDKIAEQILMLVTYLLLAIQCMKLLDNPEPLTPHAQINDFLDSSSSGEPIDISDEELNEQTPDKSDYEAHDAHSSAESLSSK